VERHWIESEVPEWILELDERVALNMGKIMKMKMMSQQMSQMKIIDGHQEVVN